MKKPLAAAAVTTAVGLATFTGIGIANAETATSGTRSGHMSGMVDALAAKFKLDKTEVRAVFDEQHAKMAAQRDADVKSELDQLVTDGKLTRAQADTISAKRAEIQKQRDELRDSDTEKTREEMRTEMQAKRADIEKWAEDNGIATQYIRLIMGGGRDHGGGMSGQRG